MQKTNTGDSGPQRPETPVWAETPGRLRTNSGFKTAAAVAKLFNAEKPDGPETPDLEGGNSGPAGNSGEIRTYSGLDTASAVREALSLKTRGRRLRT